MITFEHCLSEGKDFGVHCATREEVQALAEYIYSNYPEKKNPYIDICTNWGRYAENTVVFPNILNCNWAMVGRLGGNAARKRRVYEFFELEVIDDLPIERSDMDIESILGL